MNAKPGLTPLLIVLAVLGLGIALLNINLTSITPRYGTVYQITKGFYTGCTGRAIRVSGLGDRVTLDNVVCVRDSLGMELDQSTSSLVVWQDAVSEPGPYDNL